MIEWTGFRFPKGQPRVVAKIEKARTAAQEERDCRAKVDARDGRRCFVDGCRLKATEKHHIVSRSVRGKTEWNSSDILSACQRHHSMFKAGLIRVEGNPDVARVKVFLTALGTAAKIKLPRGQGEL